MKRHRIIKIVWDFFDEQGFIEIETPMPTKSTPSPENEGTGNRH